MRCNTKQECTFFVLPDNQNKRKEKMKVKCPQCNTEYEVDESMRGQKFNCLNENCPGIIAVPKPFSSQNNRASRQRTADKYNRAGRQRTADRYNTASTRPSDLLWEMHDCFSLQKKCIWGILISRVLFIIFVLALGSVEPVFFLISLVFCVIVNIVFLILILKFFYKAWKLLPKDRAITTPNKAIWLNFVPGLFPFWQWVTYFELGKAYSDLSGRRANKVFALIVSVMNFLGMWLLLLLPWVIIMMVFQGELLRSAEIIVNNQTRKE